MIDEKFEATSRRVQACADHLADFAYSAEYSDDVRCSFHHLTLIKFCVDTCYDIIKEAEPEFDALPVIGVQHFGFHGQRQVFNTYHEFVMQTGQLATVLFLYATGIWPQPPKGFNNDEWKAVLSSAVAAHWEGFKVNRSAMTAGIRKERALILKSNNDQLSARPPVNPVWLGDGRFLYDGVMRTIDGAELAVTKALINFGALKKPDLEKLSQVPGAASVFHKLAEKYPAAYHKPGRRNRGGYSLKFSQATAEKAS